MPNRQYERQTPHKKRRINWFGILFWLLILVIVTAAILLVISYRKPYKEPETIEFENDNNITETTTDTPEDNNGEDIVIDIPEDKPEENVEETPIYTPEDNGEETPEEKPKEETEEEPEENSEETPEEIPEEEAEETPVAGVTDPDSYSEESALVVAYAKSAVDVPYEFGGSGPTSFDTSGLVSYCFEESGISVPRRVSEQAEFGTEVSREDLQPGDVVFFYFENEGEAEYVGIYIGNDTFIAARSTKGSVGEINMSGYYDERFVCARRYFE